MERLPNGSRILAPGELDPDTIEQCAIVAERQNRAGREWVRDSLWDNIISRVPEAIRSMLPG